MWESIIDKSLVMTLKIENNLTRKEAEQIIHLMSWAVEKSKNASKAIAIIPETISGVARIVTPVDLI